MTLKVITEEDLSNAVGNIAQINAVVKGSKLFTITSDEGLATAAVYLSKIAAIDKKLEEEEEEIVGPIRNGMQDINAGIRRAEKFFGGLHKLTAEARTLIRGEIVNYEKRQVAEAEVEQEVLEIEAQEEHVATPEGEHLLPVHTAPIVPIPQVSVSSESGSVGTRAHWCYKVEDIKLVPADLLDVKSKEVHQRIRRKKDPVREIPGLDIYDARTVVEKK